MTILNDIYNLIDKLELSPHTKLRYRQILSRLQSKGIKFKLFKGAYTITNNDQQLKNTILNMTKNNTNDIISDNYKLDFFSCLKALHRQNIIILNAAQLGQIESEFIKFRALRGNTSSTQTYETNLTLLQIQNKIRQSELSAQKLMLAMLTFMPTKRLELRNLKLITQRPPKDGQNYLAHYRSTLVFYYRDYIGSDSKGEEIFILTDNNKNKNLPNDLIQAMNELYDMIQLYIEQAVLQNYLFETQFGQLYSQASFSQLIIYLSKAIVGEALSLNFYRHLFVSTYKAYQQMPTSQLESIANIMGHSMQMQNEYFVLDLAKKSNMQELSNFQFDITKHKVLGKFEIFQDIQSGNYILVKLAIQD